MFDGMEFGELYAYFREMHKQVTDHDIVAYAHEYRGQEPEKADLRQFYEVTTILCLSLSLSLSLSLAIIL